MSAINPPADYNYELKTGYIKQLLENTGEQFKKKKAGGYSIFERRIHTWCNTHLHSLSPKDISKSAWSSWNSSRKTNFLANGIRRQSVGVPE